MGGETMKKRVSVSFGGISSILVSRVLVVFWN